MRGKSTSPDPEIKGPLDECELEKQDPLAAFPGLNSAGRNLDDPIPPRPWLLGSTFCRQVLSGLTGPGGVGKSALRLLQLITLALGLGHLVGERVYRRAKVLLVSFEDGEAEVRRRLRAACLHHDIVEADLNNWFYYWCPFPPLHFLDLNRDRDVVAGELGDKLKRIVKALDIGVVCVDPFVRSHGVQENSNGDIDQVASAFLQIGHECGCAVDYVHHHRKGSAAAGDVDIVRGASALVDASRLVKTVTKMTKEEAKELGVDESERRSLIRLDDAKLNFAPPAAQTTWFRLVGVGIGNATDDYPAGDCVQTVELWSPVDVWKTVTAGVANRILDELEEVREPDEPGQSVPRGRRYSRHSNAKRPAWVVVQTHCGGFMRRQCQQVIETWVRNGVLLEGSYYDTEYCKRRNGLTVAKRPGKA
jgi:AAA domain-containing protein